MSFLSLNSYLSAKADIKSSGDLEKCPVYMVIGNIYRNKLSGKLVISRGERIKHLYFDKGNAISVKSNLVAESLDSILVRIGLLNIEQIRKITKEIETINFLENLDFDQKLLLYLKERRLVSNEDLSRALKRQFMERVMNLFGWFSGEYSFEQDSHLVYSLSSMTVPLFEIYRDIEELLYPQISQPGGEKELEKTEGNFKEVFFPALMKNLIESGATGKLIVQKKDRTKELRIHKGIPVSISSDHPSEKISTLLCRMGLVTHEQKSKMEEEMRFLRSDFLKHMAEAGMITEEKAKIAKAIHYTESFLELFAWRSGLYKFEKRRSIRCGSCGTQVQIKPELDASRYSCPRCSKRLEDPGQPARIVFRSEPSLKKAAKAALEEPQPKEPVAEAEQQVETDRKKVILTGETLEDLVCTDCGRKMDPIIKRCLHCTDETLLDNFQFMKKKVTREDLQQQEVLTVGAASKEVDFSQFSVLGNNLISLALDRQAKILVFTSPSRKSGKSFVVLNCAANIAENYAKRVLLIDMNFLNPSLSFPLGVKPEFDIRDVLSKKIDIREAVYETAYDNLFLLPIKKASKKADLFLSKDHLDEILANLKDDFDLFLIDSSGVQESKLEEFLIAKADGVVIVVRKGATTATALERFITGLKSGKVLGCVMNGLESSP